VVTSSLIVAGCLVLALFERQKHSAERTIQKPALAQLLPRATPTAPTATPLTADTELVVDPQGAGRAFVLRRGSARFVVPHDDRYPFRVRVGSLVIEDLGTIFSVVRLSEYKVDVVVEEGHVAALCDRSRIELGGGQRRTFVCGEPQKQAKAAPPWAAARAEPAGQAGSAASREGLGTLSAFPSRSNTAERPEPASEPPHPHSQASPAWRLLAEQGQYREAYDSLHGESGVSVRDETHELLLAADTARLSGHSSEAVPYLRRILVQHGNDPRVDLVAFTLGRVLLDELGRPAEAAEAFERARARDTPLAEDALAREIEAWARAGDARRAHTLALEYRGRYPQGRRMRAVAKFGGLER
jgi:transmembrane sensor